MTGGPARRDALNVVQHALRELDQRDWRRYRAAFADRLHLDYSTWRPDSIGWWPADDWVARVSTGCISDCDTTQYCLTSPVVTDDGDHLLLDPYGEAEDASPAASRLAGSVDPSAARTTHAAVYDPPKRDSDD